MWGRVAQILRSPSGRDSVLTTLTEALSMLGMVLGYRLAADSSKQDLDLYVIVRRTVAFAFPVVLLGMMVGLTRFVAMNTDPATRRRYLRGALMGVLPLGVLLCLACLVMPGTLAWIVFGRYEDAPMVLPVAIMTLGIALHGVAYGYLRGMRSMVIANLLQLFVLGVSPCVAFLACSDLTQVLWATGVSWTVAPLLTIAPAVLARRTGSPRRERAELLRYGLPRVPGDIALGALLTVPGYVVLRTQGIDASGEMGFGTTLLNIAAAVFSPVALLLLPSASAQLAGGDHARLARRIERMVWIVLGISAAMTIGYELLADPLLRAYLGEKGMEYVATSRLVFLAALPFGFFNGMRSVLDAYYQTPRNGVNLVVASIILLLGSALHLVVPTPWYTMGVVLIIALGYLGLATYRDVRYVRTELERLAAHGTARLKVLVVIPDVENGETYRDSKAQAAAFVHHGAEVVVFHLADRTSPFALWRSRRHLKIALRKLRPDVVHVHFGSVAALWTVLSSPLPVVVTFMGDDLDRSNVPGFARSFMGVLFSQFAAFFAAGIICTDTRVRDLLWWRTSEARVIALGGEDAIEATEVLEHLRRVAFHNNAIEPALP